jgi:hypothetical protein
MAVFIDCPEPTLPQIRDCVKALPQASEKGRFDYII